MTRDNTVPHNAQTRFVNFDWITFPYIVDYAGVMASEVRFPDVRKMLEAKGYRLIRVNGSHHIFAKTGTGTFAVPVHHGKVKPVYVRQIQKLE